MKRLVNQISAAADDVYGRLYNETSNARKPGITSDDLSSAMVPFLMEAKGLLDIPGSVGVVFGLVKSLGDMSYGDLDSGCGYGDRPSDPMVDELLSKLARSRRDEDQGWDFVNLLDDLKRRDDRLKKYGIEDYCVRTRKLLSDWMEGLPEGTNSAPDIKATSPSAKAREFNSCLTTFRGRLGHSWPRKRTGKGA